MVKVSDVMMGIRSKLGDTDRTKERYSDPQIIDAINDCLDVLSEELLCFRRTWLIETKDGVGRYLLPADHLRPISLSYNGKLITDIESMEHRQNSCLFSGVSASYDLQTLHIFPADTIKDGHVIEFYYHYFETINDERDVIALPRNAKLAIVYFACASLVEDPNRKDALQRSQYYSARYEEKLTPLRSRVRANAQSKNIRSKFKKV